MTRVCVNACVDACVCVCVWLKHALNALWWWYDAIHLEAVFRLYLAFGCQRMYPFDMCLLLLWIYQRIDVLILELV